MDLGNLNGCRDIKSSPHAAIVTASDNAFRRVGRQFRFDPMNLLQEVMPCLCGSYTTRKEKTLRPKNYIGGPKALSYLASDNLNEVITPRDISKGIFLLKLSKKVKSATPGYQLLWNGINTT
ncbi:hypothetical protein Pelo_19324 [Pelomyxa schiedti]|nr:hypothetical protein Pelo_19324 [Pelomyxa schiedti]